MSNTCTIYGIRNCDTMKKAMRWLDQQGIEFELHDYKKAGIDTDTLVGWLKSAGPEVLVNRRGTTFRKLSDDEKSICAGSDLHAIAEVLATNSSAIKRPVLPLNDQLLVGFKEADWADTFKTSAES